MARRRRVRNPFSAGRIGHTKKGVAYHVGNSLRGLRLMKRFGKQWADRDIRKTKDGKIVVCHWPKPGIRDGFILGWRGKPRTTEVSTLTWDEVSRLRTADGYRINRIETDLAELGRLRMGAYLEPKDDRLANRADWDYIVDVADSHGVRLRGYALPAHAAVLPFMRAVGIPAHQLKGR